MKKTRQKLRTLYLFCLIVFLASSLQAQDFDKATSESELLEKQIQKRINKETSPQPITTEIEEKEPPEKVSISPEEEKKIYIKNIILDGAETIKPEEFASLMSPHFGRENTIAEIKSLSKKIEREYIKKGVIAVVFLPPQEVQDGVIHLQVVEAKMGEVHIKENKYFGNRKLKTYWLIPKGKVIKYELMRKSLYRMDSNPDRKVKAILHAGETPGTTDITLSSVTKIPIHTGYEYDREGIPFTGVSRHSISFKHNNLLFLDDTLYAGRTFGKFFDSYYIVHFLPITPYGTKLVSGYVASKACPQKEYAHYFLESRARTTMFSLHQSIIEEKERFAEVFAGIDFKKKTTTSYDNSELISRSSLNVLNLGTYDVIKIYKGSMSINPALYIGIGPLWTKYERDLVSSEASSQFVKFNFNYSHKRFLPFDIEYNTNVKWQIASRKLPSQEQISMGGLDTVRGYPQGDYGADAGLIFNTEMIFPNFLIPKNIILPYAEEPLRYQIRPMIFFDSGYGEIRDPGSGDNKHRYLMSVGTGLRLSFNQNFILRLEWGFPIGNKPMSRSGKSAFHINLTYNY